MPELPIEPVIRIIRNAGAEKVSRNASHLLAHCLVDTGEKIIREAEEIARDAGRKTVGGEDIASVLRSYSGRHISTRIISVVQEAPIEPIPRIIRNAWVERISANASHVLEHYLEDTGKKLSKKAVRYSRHAGRKTVKAVDIEKAILEFGPGPFGP